MDRKKNNSLDWSRRIRDQQAKDLEEKSVLETLEYYRSASRAFRDELKLMHIGSETNRPVKGEPRHQLDMTGGV